MIKKFMCWLLGHKIIIKAYTGKTYDTTDRLTGNTIKGNYYKWQQMKFCLRCGEKNSKYPDFVGEDNVMANSQYKKEL